ncbi:ABC transporter substrate-binding protein [Pseudoalteromonas xiamenensis]
MYSFLMPLFLLVFTSSSFAAHLRIQVPSDYIPKKGETPVDIGATVFAHVARLVDEKIDLEYMPASHQREWRELRSNPYACLYNKQKTSAREKDAIFSHYPLIAFPSIRLVLRKSITLPDSVSLNVVLQSTNLKIGVVKGRSYGEQLDTIIEANKAAFVWGEGLNSAFNHRERVAKGTLDGVLEYSEVYLDHFANRPESDEVTFHSIEGVNETVFGYIACARSVHGKMAIASFDEAMDKPEYFNYMINMHRVSFPAVEFQFLKDALEAAYQIPAKSNAVPPDTTLHLARRK